MGMGNFVVRRNNVNTYVMNLYNETKYLEPSLSFKVFIRYISKNLPREIQTNVMMREISDMNELEKILYMFQNIWDREMSKKKIREEGTRMNTDRSFEED